MVRSPVTFQCAGSRASTRVLLNVIAAWSLPPSRSGSMSRLMRRSLVTSTLATGIDALTDDAAGRAASLDGLSLDEVIPHRLWKAPQRDGLGESETAAC